MKLLFDVGCRWCLVSSCRIVLWWLVDLIVSSICLFDDLMNVCSDVSGLFVWWLMVSLGRVVV